MSKIRRWHHIIITLTIMVCLSGQAFGQEYKAYSKTSSRQLYFKLMYNEDRFGYSVEKDGTTDSFMYDRTDMRVSGDKLLMDNRILIDSEGLHVGLTV